MLRKENKYQANKKNVCTNDKKIRFYCLILYNINFNFLSFFQLNLKYKFWIKEKKRKDLIWNRIKSIQWKCAILLFVSLTTNLTEIRKKNELILMKDIKELGRHQIR